MSTTSLPSPHELGFAPGAVARSNWRPMSGAGCIVGVPNSGGTAIATNGVLIAIDQGGPSPFIGHLQYWEPYKEPREPREPKAKPDKRKSRVTQNVEDFE